MEKKIRQLACAWLLAGACAWGYAQENQTYILHTIEKGQSLYSIASMYGVSQADIVRLNPGSGTQIYAGHTLRIPRSKTNSNMETFHTIKAGETLYGLSVKYNVAAKAICGANPGLGADNFRTGQVIRIPAAQESEAARDTTGAGGNAQAPARPRCRDMHKVKRRETVYSISREYGITQAELIAANPELEGKDKIKRGTFLCIPYPAAQVKQPAKKVPTDTELFKESRQEPRRINTVKAAIILPFLPAGGNSQGETARMVEYYEGFLLAMDSLKRGNVSIDLYTYNVGGGTASVNGILAKKELQDMHVIFGPLQQSQIKPLADFARKHGIRLVIPFTSKDNTVFKNPAVYQINTQQSYLYSEVYNHFLRQFPSANVIFIEPSAKETDKADFIKGLRSELAARSIAARSVSEDTPAESLVPMLKSDRPNIFIPTTGNHRILSKVLPQLTLMARENPEYTVHLFGYPEWQTYTKDFLDAFFGLDTYFYTSFYTNNLLPTAKNFSSKYRKWYGKEMEDRYPKYGMLGFDTGYFFLKGLSRYGTELEKNLQNMDLMPIQAGFKFQRVNNWGGFINKKVYFVHFTKGYQLLKLDFD